MGAFGGLFHLGQAVETPPAQYASGPTQTGKTWTLELPDPAQVDYLCQTYLGGLPEHSGPNAYYMGCYNPRLDAVIVPAKGAWPSEDERQQIIAHELAHGRGWRHNPDGRGTGATSLPPITPPVSPGS